MTCASVVGSALGSTTRTSEGRWDHRAEKPKRYRVNERMEEVMRDKWEQRLSVYLKLQEDI